MLKILWIYILISVINDKSNTYGKSIAVPCTECERSINGYICGDGHCCCIEEWACCYNKSLTYIPEFPKPIASIEFSYNSLTSLSADTFNNITDMSIKTLRLRHNPIENISKDAFLNLSRLQELDLKGDLQMDHSQLSMSFYHIQKKFELKVILDECGLVNMPDDFFKGFQDSKVVSISLKKNRIAEYDESQFQYLTTLQTLDLSNNWIETIRNVSNGKRVGHKSLENLILADNQFLKYPPWFCDNDSKTLYPSLKKLDLSGNFIIYPVRDAWSCLLNLTHLLLAKNVLQIIQTNVFSDLISLQMLNISHMVRSIKKFEPHALNISSLTHLHFEHNHMKFKPDSDIDYSNLFRYMPNLRCIHLESNEFQLNDSAIVQMLQPLSQLEHLHLGATSLRGIPDNFLYKFRNLTVLNLSRNKISWIEPSAFYNVTNLKELFLYENRIEQINSTSFPDSLINSLTKLHLADNPFSCIPCQNMWFRNWIRTNQRTKKVDFPGWPSNYTCHNPKDMRGKFLKDYNPKLEDCKEKNPLISVYIVIGVFLVIVIICGTAGYRGRWYLRYWTIRLKWKFKRRGDNDPERQGLLQTEVIYDVYVIYEDNDVGFVRHTLLPFMEEQNGYRLFIRDREAEQGAKVDIMVENIYRSNFVIAVVSRKFLKDQWCEFQLAVTIDRQVDLKRNFLLLITLEDVDRTLLSKSWCVLLTKTPTAEWCDKKNDIKRKLFDKQITTTIPHRKSHHNVTGQINTDLISSER